MELLLRGFENEWAIDTAHDEKGVRWANLYQRVGPRWNDWEITGKFLGEGSIGQALDCLIENLKMTEEQVCDFQISAEEDPISFMERLAHIGG